MPNILAVNCGSSSIKFKVVDIERSRFLLIGSIDRVGQGKGHFKIEYPGQERKLDLEVTTGSFREAFALLLKNIDSEIPIHAVGHRVVHGGDYFRGPCLVNKEVVEKVEEFSHLAPLHNKYEAAGIRACMEIFHDIPHAVSVDTAFHMDRAEENLLFALPYSFYKEKGIRKYGFHGMSHKYVARSAATILKRELADLKIVSCHLGNGATVTAIRNGKSLESSANFGTMCGLPMGSRSGDFDPSLILYMLDYLKMSSNEIFDTIYRKSGLLGISGISSDAREVIKACEGGNERARLALRIFTDSIKKYIGSYAALMNGVDAIVFTAGIGENSPYVRAAVCSDMEYLGLFIDEGKNKEKVMGNTIISSRNSKVKVLVIPTNEELIIAEEVMEALGKQSERIGQLTKKGASD